MTPTFAVWMIARARIQDATQTWGLRNCNPVVHEGFALALKDEYLRDWIRAEGCDGCR